MFIQTIVATIALAVGPHSLNQWLEYWEISMNRKVLIIGDSTNTFGGAGTPYAEMLLNGLPSGSLVSGTGLSVSTGNSHDGVLNGTSQHSRFTGGYVGADADTAPHTLSFTPAGLRMQGGPIASPGLTSFAAVHAIGVDDSTNFSPQGEGWIAGNNVTMSLVMIAGQTANNWIDQLQRRRATDFGGSAGVNSWSTTVIDTQQIASVTDGLVRVDATHTSPTDHRVGMQVRGVPNGDDPTTIGDYLSTKNAYITLDSAIGDPAAYFLDAIGVGGWTATDFADKHDSTDYAHHIGAMPEVPDTIVIWLGQNIAAGEWTGTEWTATFDAKITNIVEDIRAAYVTLGEPAPTFRLAAPPQMSGTYADSRFDLLRSQYTSLAATLGSDVEMMDLYGPPGDTLTNIDAGYDNGDNIHPSATGASYVADYFWDTLEASFLTGGNRSRSRDRLR